MDGADGSHVLASSPSDTLRDDRLESSYLIVDALDECTRGLNQLLDFISMSASDSAAVKWVVSSRYRSEIEHRLGSENMLSLEVNGQHVDRAINAYIESQVSRFLSFQDETSIRDKTSLR